MKRDKSLTAMLMMPAVTCYRKKGDTENDFLYTGEQYNANTELYYLRARYMDPSTGTFISMDSYQGSIYDPVSLHKYLYANANPVTYNRSKWVFLTGRVFHCRRHPVHTELYSSA